VSAGSVSLTIGDHTLTSPSVAHLDRDRFDHDLVG
jgi:hypothetical protein